MKIILHEKQSIWCKYLAVITSNSELARLKWREIKSARKIEKSFQDGTHIFRRFKVYLKRDLFIELYDTRAMGMSLTSLKMSPEFDMASFRCGNYMEYKTPAGETRTHFCDVKIRSSEINPKTGLNQYLDWKYEQFFKELCRKHPISKADLKKIRRTK